MFYIEENVFLRNIVILIEMEVYLLTFMTSFSFICKIDTTSQGYFNVKERFVNLIYTMVIYDISFSHWNETCKKRIYIFKIINHREM